MLIGNYLAGIWRMPDHAWKISLTLGVLAGSILICLFGQFKYGPDLAGGITLIYELQDAPKVTPVATTGPAPKGAANQQIKSGDRQFSTSELIGSLKKRLDPDGTKEITIREYGPAVEIIIPQVGQDEMEFVKQKIISDYGKNQKDITVFPWGIDLELFSRKDRSEARRQLNLDAGKFIIIFNRHFEPVYGVSCLLEAFAKFSEGKSDVEMLMLSEGSGKTEALRYITEKGLDDKIRILGRVPNKDLPLLLSASDIYVSPSLSDGTSLSLLEAMACGTGLVVTDVPAIKEWVTADNGIMAPRGDSGMLAEAMEKYYRSRELVELHGERNTVIAAERANWDKNYLKLKEIYAKLLK
jgi:glycosyltransferase involved in cell wall biosynthesis